MSVGAITGMVCAELTKAAELKRKNNQYEMRKAMTEVISVRFKNKGKVYFFDPAGLIIPSNVNVIVETSKGLEYAECTYGNHFVEDTAIIPPLRPVTRIATAEDDKKATENKAKEAEAFAFCQKKIEEHGLDMKLVDVEFNFEGSKILFFFTSEGVSISGNSSRISLRL